MQPKFEKLSLLSLQKLFIKEGKAFLEALEKQETGLQLEERRVYLKQLNQLIEQKIREQDPASVKPNAGRRAAR